MFANETIYFTICYSRATCQNRSPNHKNPLFFIARTTTILFVLYSSSTIRKVARYIPTDRPTNRHPKSSARNLPNWLTADCVLRCSLRNCFIFSSFSFNYIFLYKLTSSARLVLLKVSFHSEFIFPFRRRRRYHPLPPVGGGFCR